MSKLILKLLNETKLEYSTFGTIMYFKWPWIFKKSDQPQH